VGAEVGKEKRVESKGSAEKGQRGGGQRAEEREWVEGENNLGVGGGREEGGVRSEE
jgi:hypothetical protein